MLALSSSCSGCRRRRHVPSLRYMGAKLPSTSAPEGLRSNSPRQRSGYWTLILSSPTTARSVTIGKLDSKASSDGQGHCRATSIRHRRQYSPPPPGPVQSQCTYTRTERWGSDTITVLCGPSCRFGSKRTGPQHSTGTSWEQESWGCLRGRVMLSPVASEECDYTTTLRIVHK